MPLGEVGFWVGLIIAMSVGAFTYRRFKLTLAGHREAGVLASLACGLATAVVATAVFVPMGVQEWLGVGDWRSSAFLAVCFGIIQGALFKGRPDLAASYREGKAKRLRVPERVVAVGSFSDEAAAGLARAQLAAKGIRAEILAGERANDAAPGIRLAVLGRDLEAAREILNAASDGRSA